MALRRGSASPASEPTRGLLLRSAWRAVQFGVAIRHGVWLSARPFHTPQTSEAEGSGEASVGTEAVHALRSGTAFHGTTRANPRPDAKRCTRPCGFALDPSATLPRHFHDPSALTRRDDATIRPLLPRITSPYVLQNLYDKTAAAAIAMELQTKWAGVRRRPTRESIAIATQAAHPPRAGGLGRATAAAKPINARFIAATSRPLGSRMRAASAGDNSPSTGRFPP